MGLCGSMRAYVGLCGPMWTYVGLCPHSTWSQVLRGCTLQGLEAGGWISAMCACYMELLVYRLVVKGASCCIDG